jgi:fatty-acyl-CoA synthase
MIRVLPEGESGSRVDVRSVSRVGLSDLGANAKRVKLFLEDFEARL